MIENKRDYLSDYWTLNDDLHFDVFKPALLNIINRADTPITIGVFGTWGSGKTTLLQMLKSESSLNHQNTKTVWFTAWKYGQQQALWRAFMLRVVDGLFPRNSDGGRLDHKHIKNEKIKEGVQYLERLERSIYETVHWQEEGKWSLDFGELAKQGIRIPIWLAFHLTGMGSISKDLGINPEFTAILERHIREHHLNQLVSIEQFAHEFEKAISLILGEDGRLVVFVDDLDRCLPEKALEVLEAIKLFLDVPGTIFVLGMDREVIRRGIETHYGSLLEIETNRMEIPVNGDVYLQKMIQIPFNLPPLDIKARRDYILKLEANLPPEFKLDETTLDVFAKGLLPNPRQIKRALNVFYLLKNIGIEQENRELIPNGFLAWPLLAKTVLIQSQWPELYQLWRQYPTLIQILEEEYTSHPLSETMILQGYVESNETIDDVENKPYQQSRGFQYQATGLISEYLNNRHKYPLLAKMLQYPEEEQMGRRAAKFSGLTRSQIQLYVGLVGAIESDGENVSSLNLPEDILQILHSGDLVHIQEVVSNIDEIEEQPDGPQHKALGKQLINISQNSNIPLSARFVAAKAASNLKVLPKDLYKFIHVPTPKKNHKIYFGKYPVTNLQYKRFVESPDFMDKSLWSNISVIHQSTKNDQENLLDAGWKWLQDQLRKTDTKVLLPEIWVKDKSIAGWQLLPVVTISWWEANAYCNWLIRNWNNLEESDTNLSLHPISIRMPTDTEWICAAGGTEPAQRFPWDKEGEATKDVTEIQKRANLGNLIGAITPVNMFPLGSSPLGIWDMCGNILEWQANYKNREEGWVSLRGSAWFHMHEVAQTAVNSNSCLIDDRFDYVGFRVAVIAES